MIVYLKQSRIIKVYITFFEAKMLVSKLCHFPTSWSPHDESFLDKERLVYLFQGTLILPYCGCYGIRSHRTTLEFSNNGLENLVIDSVQSPLIYIKCIPQGG